MARIPQYQQQRLTSSVVGVPQIDNSGAIIAQSVEKAAGQVADASFAIAAKRQEALDSVEAATQLTNYKIGAMDAFKQHQTTYANDPSQKTKIFQDQLSEQLNNQLSGIKNDRVKAAVQRGAQNDIQDMIGQQLNWAYKQEVNVAGAKIAQNTNNLAYQANAIASDGTIQFEEKLQMMDDIFNTHKDNIMAAGGVLSPEQHSKFQADGQQSIAKGFIYGMIDKNPAQANVLLNSDYFSKVLSPDDLHKMRADGQTAMKNYDEKLEWQRVSEEAVANPDLYQRAVNGQLSLAEIDAMAPTPFVKQVREILLTNSPKAVADNAADTIKLWDQWAQLGISKDKQSATGTLGDVIQFQQNVLTAQMRGAITPATAQSFLQDLSVPTVTKVLAGNSAWTADQIKEYRSKYHFWSPDHWFGTPAEHPYQTGYNLISNYLTSTGKDQDFNTKYSMIQKFTGLSSAIGKMENGKPLTATDVAHKAMGIAIGDTVQTKLGPRKITGYVKDKPWIPTVQVSDSEQKQINAVTFEAQGTK